ncbi:MAG: hypothetical protein U9R21_07340 [Candidatus Thermoplasmatota archaeon]|nr:hypothetical protein [Candidatus Thermoplasmatota archaeon]
MNAKIIGLILAALFLFMIMSMATANLNSLDLADIDPWMKTIRTPLA